MMLVAYPFLQPSRKEISVNDYFLIALAALALYACFSTVRLFAARESVQALERESADCAAERQRIAWQQRDLDLQQIMDFREKDPGYLAIFGRQDAALKKMKVMRRWMVFHAVMVAASICAIVVVGLLCADATF